jgi:hypothetical protein
MAYPESGVISVLRGRVCLRLFLADIFARALDRKPCVLLRRQAALAWARGESKPGTCDPTKSTFDLCRAIATVHAYEGNLLDAAKVLDLTEDGHIVAIRVAELIERRMQGPRKRRKLA